MQRTRWRKLLFAAILVLVAGGMAAGALWLFNRSAKSSNTLIRQWLNDPDGNMDLASMGGIACADAPFILPSSGFIGLLWADPSGPYTILNRHTGIDIFGNGEPGTVPVFAAYEGYLTRLDNWISTVAIQHDDPLQPGRTIWTYYTHMASVDGTQSFIAADFPQGTYALPVPQGALLGYQGDYAGPGRPAIAMHVHFTVVRAEDDGAFKNEAVLENTLDPSPYLGMNVDITNGATHPVRCHEDS